MIRNANLLYLGSILLVVFLGGAAQRWHMGWGLIFTEVVCILLPTLLMLRREGTPWSEALAWRPAPRLAVMLAIPIGLGTWALGALLTGIMVAITGYQAPSPAMPTGIGAIAFFLALTLFAPVCEEILFRGYLFKAYAQWGVRAALVAPALLFAFYHLRLQGLPGLLPAAFAFGFLRWRTGSLHPGIAAHFAQNAMAGSLALLPMVGVEPPVALLAGGLPVLVLAGLAAFVLFLRLTPAPAGAPVPPGPAPTGRLAQAWPLIPFAALYLYVGGVEAGFLPGISATTAVPQDPPALRAASIDQPRTWRYEMRNVDGEAVGSMDCRLAPESDTYVITCRSSNRAWRIERGNSVYQSDANTSDTVMRWSRSDLRLLELTQNTGFGEGGFRREVHVAPAGQGLHLRVTSNVGREGLQELTVPSGAVFAAEWAWRLALTQFDQEQSMAVALAWPTRWSPKRNQVEPALEAGQLTIAPGGALAGRSATWVASLGTAQKAWYDAQAPHVLLKLDNGFESFHLIEN